MAHSPRVSLGLAAFAVLLPLAESFATSLGSCQFLGARLHRRTCENAGMARALHGLQAGVGIEDLTTRSEVLRQLALPLAGAAAFRTGAAIAVIGQPRMPPLTGTHGTVGVRVLKIPFSSGKRNGSCRAKVFYPALEGKENTDAAYCTDGRETSDGMAGLVGFRQLGLSFLLAHLADAKSGTALDAPPVQDARFPLLVYSHGYGGNMDMGTYLMRQIAAHGAVVVALEHTDGTASSTRLADGALLKFSPRLLSGL